MKTSVSSASPNKRRKKVTIADRAKIVSEFLGGAIGLGLMVESFLGQASMFVRDKHKWEDWSLFSLDKTNAFVIDICSAGRSFVQAISGTIPCVTATDIVYDSSRTKTGQWKCESQLLFAVSVHSDMVLAQIVEKRFFFVCVTRTKKCARITVV